MLLTNFLFGELLSLLVANPKCVVMAGGDIFASKSFLCGVKKKLFL
jgi:hypothetical protein